MRIEDKWKIKPYTYFVKNEWVDNLKEFLLSTSLSNYKLREIFESKLSEYCKCKYTVAVNSGTSAILMSMAALGLKKGDTVIGPNYGNFAWANCCRFLELNVITIDVRRDNFCLDEKLLKDYLDKHPGKIKAACYINQAGYTGPQLMEVASICKYYNVLLLEDSCNAIGQWYNGKHAGTTGDVGFISFGTPKLLTCGEGGAILINNDRLYKVCKDLSYQGGWYSEPVHTRLNVGVNFVMPTQNAYFLSSQLDDIDELLLMRKTVCDEYVNAGFNIQRFHQPPSIYMHYSTNPLKVIKSGASFKVQFLFKSYSQFGHLFGSENTNTPVANDLENHIITLPNMLKLDKSTINIIKAAVKFGER